MNEAGFSSGRRSRGDRRNGRGPRSRRRLWLLLVLLLVIIAAIVYVTAFHVSQVGPRTVLVNGEDVGSVDGISVRGTTFINRSEAQTFLEHIQAGHVKLPTATKNYHGVDYLSLPDLVHTLNRHGDKTSYAADRLSVTLPASQHYTYQEKGDTVRQQAVWVNGQLSGYALDVYHDEANYLPASELAVLLTQEGLKAAWDGHQLDIALTGKASPTAAVERPGEDGAIAFGNGKLIYAPDLKWLGQTYLPVNSLSAALRQVGYTDTLSTWKWSLRSKASGAGTSGTTSASKPVSLGFVPFYSGDLAAYDDVLHHPSSYNALASDTWTVDANGSLSGSAPAGAGSQAAAAGDTVYAMIANLGGQGFDAHLMSTILSDQTRSTRLRDDIAKVVANDGYDGAMLDFETIPKANRAAYTAFVQSLAGALHAEGKRLSIVIPPDTGYGNEPWNGAYDVAKLGAAADTVVVMAYDYSYVGGPAGPIAPIPWVQQVLAYTVSRVPADKVLLGVDAYGYDWSGKHTTPVSLPQVADFLSARHIQPSWNASAEAPWYTWTDSHGAKHTVYYENAKSTKAKLALAQTYGVRGVALWRAGLEDEAVLGALAGYAKGQPQ